MGSLKALLRRHLGLAWRHRWIAVALAWLICGAGWAVALLIPSQYEASARIYIDTDAILTPLLKGLAVETPVATQLDMLQRTLLSRPNLEKLIASTDLELSAGTPAALDSLTTQLASQVKIVPATRYLFTISYRNTRPRLAYDVVRTLLTIFVENKTGDNRKDMESAQRFLDEQVALYEGKLQALEKQRADFRARYLDVLPAGGNGGESRLDMARSAVRRLQGELDDAQARRDALAREMETTPPTLAAAMAAGGIGRQPSPLAEAEARLAELRLRYTDEFPDVIAAKRLVAALKSGAVPATPAQAAGPRGAAHNSGGSLVSNPAYEQLKLQQFETNANIASLRRQLAAATEERDRLEKILRSAPGVQAEYINLNRDYDILRKNYDELLARRESMRISTAADNTTEKVKLRVIDPPQIPTAPVAPKRALILSAVLALGLAGGAGAAVLLVQFDRSFHSVEDLLDIGLPVVGSVSLVSSPAVPLRRRLLPVLAATGAVMLLMLVYAGLLYRLLTGTGKA